MKKLYVLLMAIVAISFTGQALASYDVTLGKSVTLDGTYGTDPGPWPYYAPAAGSTLTDGIFAPETELWNLNSVWWNGYSNPANSIQIDLGGLFKINEFKVQADNNDSYLVEYRVGAGSWLTAYNVPVLASWGLVTRTENLFTPVWADALRFTATGGDGYYSVTEIQAFGESVALPEPMAYTLLLAGLVLIGFKRRRYLF